MKALESGPAPHRGAPAIVRSIRGLIHTAIALAAAALALAGCGGNGSSAGGTQRVVLALDFTPNAAHAPIYLASHEGYDKREGIKLSIRTPGSGPDSLKLLTTGRADMGVLDINDLGLARERGEDLVGVGALVQRPLAALIAQPSITRPRDLDGKRVGVSGLPSDPAFLRAILSRDGGDLSTVKQVTIGFGAVPNMVARKIMAVPAFWNAEGVELRQRGIPVREFRVDDYGAPRYPEVVLVTTRKTLQQRRPMVVHTLAAIAQGVKTMVSNRPLATQVIAAAAGNADPKLIRAQVDALASAVEPPLRLDRSILQQWSAFDARTGLLPHAVDVDQAFDFTAATVGHSKGSSS
jgi:putative hydroxymethylpyrimidine transport system substrate-binding protein